MGKQEVGMDRIGREEMAAWLEEMAGQLRNGTLMVDRETFTVPEEARTRVKSKSKDGIRTLKLVLEWPDDKNSSKTRKASKTAKKGKDEHHEQQSGNGQGSSGDGKSDTGAGGEKRGSVRDYESHVFVCRGGDCSKKGGKETKKALKSGLRAEGLNGEVRVDSVDCLGLCKQGPNVIVYPSGSWYLGLKERDVPEVIQDHLKGGEPVERLTAERKPRKQSKKKARR